MMAVHARHPAIRGDVHEQVCTSHISVSCNEGMLELVMHYGKGTLAGCSAKLLIDEAGDSSGLARTADHKIVFELIDERLNGSNVTTTSLVDEQFRPLGAN